MPEPRILIIESDDELRQTLYRCMLDHDLFSDCASTARETIGFLSQRRYSIVIVDVAVAEAADAVIAAAQRIPDNERPIILATVEGDNGAHFEADGVQVLIRRPLRVREVAGLARACIDASAQRRRKAVPRDELRAQ